jgi:Calx-beta domain/Domain of unknown function (DUF5122) beta-propeller
VVPRDPRAGDTSATLLAGLAAGAHGAASIDPTFGAGGEFRVWPEALAGVLPGPDGDLYVFLHRAVDAYEDYYRVERLGRDGQPTLTPYPDVPLRISPFAAAVRADGSPLLAGTPDGISGTLTALAPGGGLDAAFGDSGVVNFGSPVTAVAVLPDGGLLVATAGWAGYDADGLQLCLAEGWTLSRLRADGTPDTSFADGGSLRAAQAEFPGQPSCLVRHLLPQPDGRVVVISDRSLRLQADGTLDGGYQPGESFSPGSGQFSQLRDGRWFLARTVDDSSGAGVVQLQLFTADGEVDSSFGPDGSGWAMHGLGRIALGEATAEDDITTSFAIPDDGEHLFATAWTHVDRANVAGYPASGQVVARFRRDGSLDPGFGRQGVVQLTTGSPLSIVGLLPQADRGLVVATSQALYRIRNTDEGSPGLIDSRAPSVTVRETERFLRVVVSRLAGAGVPVSVRYLVEGGGATAGQDFQATAGQLDWAAGDSSDRIIDIPLLDDRLREADIEHLYLALTPLAGGALVLQESMMLGIADAGTETGDTSDRDRDSGGGGGSGDSWLLLALAAVAARRARLTR